MLRARRLNMARIASPQLKQEETSYEELVYFCIAWLGNRVRSRRGPGRHKDAGGRSNVSRADLPALGRRVSEDAPGGEDRLSIDRFRRGHQGNHREDGWFWRVRPSDERPRTP